MGRTFDPTTAFLVEDLKPNTEYAFRLAARSPQGLGAFTAVVRQRTLQAKPSAPPQDVKCTSLRSTAILVSWRPPPPETHNGALVGYSVRYRPLGSEDLDPKEVNNIPPTTTQILLEALEKWTEYRVTAVAYTEVGPGPESSPVVVRTDEDGKHQPRPYPSYACPWQLQLWNGTGISEIQEASESRPGARVSSSQGMPIGGLLKQSPRCSGALHHSCLEPGGHLHQHIPTVAC